MDFSNLNILITGASSDLAGTLIDILLSGNANIIGTYHNKNINKDIDVFKCDVSSEKDVQKLFGYIKYKYQSIDVLINMAALSMDEYFMDKTEDSFMEVMKTNVLGTFLMCKYFAKNNERGTIINMSSLDAKESYNKYNMDYAASKAAVENLTKNFAKNLKNIKVCSLAPGWIKTKNVLECDPNYIKEELEKTEQPRLLEKEEVALKIIEMFVNNDDYISGDIVYMKEGNING